MWGKDQLISGSTENIIIWNLNDLSIIRKLEGEKNVTNLLILLDNKLASSSNDGTIRIWNFENGDVIHTLKEHSENVNSLSMLKDRVTFRSASGNTLKLWDIETGQLMKTLGGHNGEILSLVLLKIGKLASGSADKTIKIWEHPKLHLIYAILKFLIFLLSLYYRLNNLMTK
jgi:WD40 repeat protein